MKSKRGAMLLMALTATMWSIGGIFLKYIPWNAFVIAGIRSAIACLPVLAFMLKKKYRIRLTCKTALHAVTLSGLALCFITANKLTTAANAIVLQYTAPIFLLLFEAVFRHKRFGALDIVTVLLTMCGIAMSFIDSIGLGRMTGNLIALAAGVFMALMFFINGTETEPERMNGLFFGHLLTAVVGIPFAFTLGLGGGFTPVLFIAILGIVQLGVPYVLYAISARNCPPLPLCLLAAIEPLLNPVWVMIFNGETPGIYSIIGGIIVIAAVTVNCVLSASRDKALEKSKA